MMEDRGASRTEHGGAVRARDTQLAGDSSTRKHRSSSGTPLDRDEPHAVGGTVETVRDCALGGLKASAKRSARGLLQRGAGYSRQIGATQTERSPFTGGRARASAMGTAGRHDRH
eukprot:gene10637-12316_t